MGTLAVLPAGGGEFLGDEHCPGHLGLAVDPFSLFEGSVDIVQREDVADNLLVGPPAAVLDQHLHHDRKEAGAEHGRADDFLGAVHAGSVEGHLTSTHNVADFHEDAAVAKIVQSLDEQARMAHEFHDDVGKAALGNVPDAFHAQDPGYRTLQC